MLDRRDFLAGAAFCGAFAPFARADGTRRAARTFRILRDGSDIGRHHLEARLEDGRFVIDIDIDIAVKFLGFTAYRYTLTNREVWTGGRIESVDSEANDDGSRGHAHIRGSAEALEVDGSEFSGTAPLSAATTSYYTPAFLDRRPWISTQSGKLLDIRTERRQGSRWLVRGDLETALVYENGEWVSSEFTARGARVTYQTTESTGQIAPLWEQA